jgi:hypothetical protein
MRSAGWLLSPLLLLAWAGDVLAQIILVPPPPPVGQSIVVGPSIGFSYRRRGLRVGGFVGSVSVVDSFGYPSFGLAPYGSVSNQVTINYYAPRRMILPPVEEDLSGVDLDVELPPWKQQPGPAAERGPPPPRKKLPEAAPPPPEKKAQVPPPEKKGPAFPPPPPAPADPQIESALLIGEGQAAFADQEYGLAAQRFRQAAVADRNSSKARFLLAQALLAVGKYREAVAAIHEGMDLDLQWPRNAFRPRLDLYKGIEGDFTAHLKDLKDSLAASPDNRFLLFLYAYQLWLDGQQLDATPVFRHARAVTVDTTYIDRFLRAAP